MAYIPRSSLIPTETSGAIPAQMKRKRTIHAFGLIATIVFIVSLISAVGMFLYKDYLGGELTNAKEALDLTSNKDNERKIAEIKYYDDKLRIARQLLDNHIATSRIFENLEDSTKATVRFSEFEFIHDPGFEALITLRGETREFSSVALQKIQILRDSMFSDFVLQDITTTDASENAEGAVTPPGVSFSVTGVFAPGVLTYEGGIGAEASGESVLPIVPVVIPVPEVSVPEVVNTEEAVINVEEVIPPTP